MDDKPKAQFISTKDKWNFNKTKESAEKIKKENKNENENIKQSSQNGIQGEPVGESNSKGLIEKTKDNKTGRAKTSGDANSQNKKRKCSTDTRSKKKNEDSDSDTSVQKTIPKKNCKRCILDLSHDDEDSSDGVPKRDSVKKEKKRKNNSHDALL